MGAPIQGRCPASEVNDGGCPEKPDHRSKGLVGVGFPRKGSGRGPNKTTGWEDICEINAGTVSRTITDDTLPGGPVERTITYETPFDLCDRVKDYRLAWEFFEKEGISS